MISNKKSWRLNYVTCFRNQDVANKSRDFVHNTLKTYAILKKIDFSIICDVPFFCNTDEDLSTTTKDTVADIVYFRSSINSLSSITDFRKIVDSLFHDCNYVMNDNGLDIFPQKISYLQHYPFPNNFYRPISFPHIDFYKEKEVIHKKILIKDILTFEDLSFS